MGGWESLMDRIPVVRSVYSAAKNFAEIVFSDSSNAFKRVLLVEYPRKGIYSLAFQTSSQLGEVQGRTGEDVVGCFVPTTPNPTSGFIIIVPAKDVGSRRGTQDDHLAGRRSTPLAVRSHGGIAVRGDLGNYGWRVGLCGRLSRRTIPPLF
jgi:uncharacterized membrane protein